MSYLHSRRRPHPSQQQSGGPAASDDLTTQQRGRDADEQKRNKSKQRQSDLLYALGIVGSFLLVGLGLGYILLHHKHRKVILHVIQSPWNRGQQTVLHLRGGKATAASESSIQQHLQHEGSPRFVTVIMPSVVNPHGRSLRLKAIADTWGPTSRAIFVVHHDDDDTEYAAASPSIADARTKDVSSFESHEYPQRLVVPPNIGNDEGVPRLMHVIRTVYKQIDPDFAFFVNDHTYVIPEHLCSFLAPLDPMDDMYLGHALKNNDEVFNSGAAGYVLSRSTMSKLVKTWDEGDPKCVIKKANQWLQGNPGLLTAKCLKHALHIRAQDTRKDQQYHRFHAFGVNRVVTGKVDQWYINKHEDMHRLAGFAKSYETMSTGVDCCADDTISFHYVEHAETRALFDVRNELLKSPSMTDEDLKATIVKEWPTGAKDLGGYARGLPTDNNEKDWSELLAVLRKISSPDYGC